MNRILETLIRLWEFDVWVFSQWWLYAPLLIPAALYLAFFFVKWMVLTAPLWLPFYCVVKANAKDDSKGKSN